MKIRTDSLLYRYSHNWLTEHDFLGKPFWLCPVTDCELFWSLLWNSFLYVLYVVTLLSFPVGFMLGMEELGHSVGILSYAENSKEMIGYLVIQWFDSFSPPLPVMVLFGVPFTAGFIFAVGGVIVGTATVVILALLYFFTEVLPNIRVKKVDRGDGDEYTETLVDVVSARWEGFKGRFCHHIEYVEPEPKED